MARSGQRKCLCCGVFFFPDQRNVGRQRYCPAADCRCASKAASQAAWLAKPDNVGYFAGPIHVQRVQAWRAAHPGYSRGRRRMRSALQEPSITQVVDAIERTADRAVPPQGPGVAALQETSNPTQALLTGLIAHLFELTLQEDMADTARRLVQRGQELMQGGGGHEDSQARAAARAAAPGARAVQLG